MKKRWNVRMMTEGGLMIALTALLNHITIYQAPQGGSVSAGGMVPLLLFAIRWGVGPGFVVGATYGLLDFILKPYFYHPVQLILDYPLAYGLLALAGLAYKVKEGKVQEYINLIIGIALGLGGRMICHVLSGVIFFRDAAGDQNPWIYSIIYNSTYLVPEFLISVLVFLLIWKPVRNSIQR